ncbi:uncharacterized protein LOC122013582 [Zingiber officinale]|uniref:uncharacterized protein LOC122013582 n=1 Tax=Zingiber officinale TaxID=94328 RepID=UPI001C4C50DF|nr:uncharacterized protein LOC122013582 [Zingiber officinale]
MVSLACWAVLIVCIGNGKIAPSLEKVSLLEEIMASQQLCSKPLHLRTCGYDAFFGIAGSRNDINVLNESPLFNDVLQGNAPEVNFTINNTQYTKEYYLTDEIYPEWATFVKSFPCPQDPKRKIFKERQEVARKDVERAFGVLQSRWAMIKGPGRFWYKDNLKDIMYTCIILHNMIIENEGDAVVN